MVKDRTEYLEFALELAQEAGDVVMRYFRNVRSERKPDGSEVTEADRRAERRLRELIIDRYPDHAVLGEEEGGPATLEEARERGFCWVLDPLDGTAGFTIGVPMFGVLIGLLHEGEPIAGVIHMPGIDETVFAAKGGGCWSRIPGAAPQKVYVAEPVPFNEAVVTTGALHVSNVEPDHELPPYRTIDYMLGAGKYRFVPDCYQHALVCRGRVHAALDTLMSPWDIAALVPCVEEAGGVCTTLEGERGGVVFGKSLLTSCHQDVHQAALDLLAPRA